LSYLVLRVLWIGLIATSKRGGVKAKREAGRSARCV